MLSLYIQAALNQARYEILEDEGSYYGEIPVCQGVWAESESLESCRKELAEVLEDWIFFRIHSHQSLPTIDGVELAIKEVA